MNPSLLGRPQRILIAAFAAVLFVRAFGLLALFQHPPTTDGVSHDRHYAKKVIYAKNDHTLEGVSLRSAGEHFEPVFRILHSVIRFFYTENSYSHSLRSPPILL